jgi:xanthine/CO dehydrogenase XdhC/CoxF family maturation factor
VTVGEVLEVMVYRLAGGGGEVQTARVLCVEGDVVAQAIDVIESGAPTTLEFGVADETAWRAGLSCGGRIKVYVERLD